MSVKYVKMLTYGCQMNFSDAERIEGELKKLGYEATDEMDKASLIIINTYKIFYKETGQDCPSILDLCQRYYEIILFYK